ncbi:MAG: ABC transporter permease [bacterium]|nr:ABC transporter permease [bacterium]
MSKFWVIFKKEYSQVVKKKSFIISILLTPIFMGGIMVVPALLANKKSTTAEKIVVVDQSQMGVGQKFVEEISEYKLEETEDNYYDVKELFTVLASDSARFAQVIDSLRNAIVEKELKYFLVIKPEAHMVDSNLYMVTNSDNFTSIKRFEYHLSQILSGIRLEQSNVNLGVDSVLEITRRIDLRTKDALGESIPFEIKYFGALILVMMMFSMVVGFGSLCMRTVIEEKNSRIMEVLVSSVSPFQLMLGKIFGLGAATFTQVSVWILMGSLLYTQRAFFDLDPSIDRLLFNPVIVIFFVLFLTTGYLLYSTAFAFIGSIVNNEKEAQGFIFPITMMLMLPVILGISVVQDPNSTMATVLSMTPFIGPSMMMMRVVFVAPTVTEYSLFSGIVGEATLALIVVILTTIFMIWLTAKIFRIGILMYGKRPNLPEILKWIRY